MKNVVIINEGFSDSYIKSKTLIGVLRYGSYNVVAVVDSKKQGLSVKQVFGIDMDIPFVKNIDAALALGNTIDVAIIGFSNLGVSFTESILSIVADALRNGIDVVNGLHHTLSDDKVLAGIAKENNSRIFDVRIPQDHKFFSRYNPHRKGTFTILTVGSDNSVGKMTTTLELNKIAKQKGYNVAFAATGQTGIILSGQGVPVDHTLADYTIGMVSNFVSKLSLEHDWIFVEGQGTVIRGNISLGLMQGSDPDVLILCHEEGREYMKDYDFWKIPDLVELKRIYEEIAGWLRDSEPAKVVGISLNTIKIKSDEEALARINRYEEKLGIPVTDPVRFGPKKLIKQLEEMWSWKRNDVQIRAERQY